MALCTRFTPTSPQDVGGVQITSPEAGFATMRRRYQLQVPESSLASTLSGAFAKGSNHSAHSNMHVVDWNPRQLAGNLWEIGVSYRGLFGTQPVKRAMRDYSETHSGNFVAPGQPTSPMQTDVSEPAVAATFLYVVTTVPTRPAYGSPYVPPSGAAFPGSPTYIWAGLVDPTYRYPNGWTLENRSIDQIAGTTVCFVQDEVLYYHPLKPGGGS